MRGTQQCPLTVTGGRASAHKSSTARVRDPPDARDVLYAAPLIRVPQGMPPAVDLRAACPPVYAQGQLGSGTANGLAGASECDQRQQGTKACTPSRLCIYDHERVLEGTVTQDSGAQVRDGITSVVTLGAPPEPDGPYEMKECAGTPPSLAYADAKLDLVSS